MKPHAALAWVSLENETGGETFPISAGIKTVQVLMETTTSEIAFAHSERQRSPIPNKPEPRLRQDLECRTAVIGAEPPCPGLSAERIPRLSSLPPKLRI